MSRRLKHIVGYAAARQQRAPDHLTGVGRIVVTIERTADQRVDAVRGDHDVCVVPDAVGKTQFDARSKFHDAHQTMTEMEVAGVDAAGKRVEPP